MTYFSLVKDPSVLPNNLGSRARKNLFFSTTHLAAKVRGEVVSGELPHIRASYRWYMGTGSPIEKEHGE